MRDLAPLDSILFALGKEDAKEQENEALKEYINGRLDAFYESNEDIDYHCKVSRTDFNIDVVIFYKNKRELNSMLIKELQLIKDKL